MEHITLTPQQAADMVNVGFGSIVVRVVGPYSPDTDWIAHARSVAADINARAGREVLTVSDRFDPLTRAELAAWTNRSEFSPGEYLTAAVFEQIRGRRPSHGEAIVSGRLLATLATSLRKDGPRNLFRLDKLPLYNAD